MYLFIAVMYVAVIFPVLLMGAVCACEALRRAFHLLSGLTTRSHAHTLTHKHRFVLHTLICDILIPRNSRRAVEAER